MKDFISRLFKKKKPDAKPEGDISGKEISGKEKEKSPAENPPSPQAEKAAEEKTPSTPPPSSPAPEAPALKKESLSEAPPVLVPLYGQKDIPPPPAPQPLPPLPQASDLKPGPHQHLPFEGDLRAAIESLSADLADVYPQSFEEWEDGFRRDDNPEQEIAGWLHLAGVLNAMNTNHSFAQPEKQECFRILIACFTGSRETVRERSSPKLLSKEQFDQAVAYFYEGGY